MKDAQVSNKEKSVVHNQHLKYIIMCLAKFQKSVRIVRKRSKQNDTEKSLVVYQCSNCCYPIESFNDSDLQHELSDSLWSRKRLLENA